MRLPIKKFSFQKKAFLIIAVNTVQSKGLKTLAVP